MPMPALTANAPIQSRTPLAFGATKSARQRLARPSGLSFCWRRLCQVISSRRAARRRRSRCRRRSPAPPDRGRTRRSPRASSSRRCALSIAPAPRRTACAPPRRPPGRRESSDTARRAPRPGRTAPVDVVDELGERIAEQYLEPGLRPRRHVARPVGLDRAGARAPAHAAARALLVAVLGADALVVGAYLGHDKERRSRTAGSAPRARCARRPAHRPPGRNSWARS